MLLLETKIVAHDWQTFEQHFFVSFSSLEVLQQTTPAVSGIESCIDMSQVMDESMPDVADDETSSSSIKRELTFDVTHDTNTSALNVSSNDVLGSLATLPDVEEPALTSPKASPRSPEIKNNEIIDLIDDEKLRRIVEIVAAQKVENQDFGFEKIDESSKPEVGPISKPETVENEKLDSEIESKIRTVRAKAAMLFSQWVNLQEMFKIPKKEMLAMRTRHEAEVDQAAAAASAASTLRNEAPKIRPAAKSTQSQSSYERGKS